ncbi:cytochrome c [Sinorhizobium mexicanum]|nr:cytochrome c [Sinorhizobium mexicanum]MBP1883436.1 cytochrome c556 [Sinorhizobium mexicanum]
MRKSVLVTTVVAALAVGLGGTLAQDATVPTPDMVALTPTGDALTARRELMDAIGTNNDVLHEMLDGYLEWDGVEFKARLEAMGAMMTAFPNLYRAKPNPWTPEAEAADPAGASLALPTVWEDWETFNAMAKQASETMFKASLEKRANALPIVEDLEAQCESCHAQFRTPLELNPLEQYVGPLGTPAKP